MVSLVLPSKAETAGKTHHKPKKRLNSGPPISIREQAEENKVSFRRILQSSLPWFPSVDDIRAIHGAQKIPNTR
jgi:hypothetical protein